MAKDMIDKANGIDNSEVITNPPVAKCISNSTTLPYDLTKKEDAYKTLKILSDNVGMTLRKQDKYAYVIAVIVKTNAFITYNHQCKLPNPTNITNEIFEASKKLLTEIWNDEPIRLLGIRVDHLVTNYAYQASLFDNNKKPEDNQKLEKTIDQLKEKYGHKVICDSLLINKKH
jgi:DNA polymerase-4